MKNYEFEMARQNALANPSLYGGRYTQEDEAEAYREWQVMRLVDACNTHLKPAIDVSDFVDSVLENEISTDSEYYEIASMYTKSGQPYVVEF